MSEHGELLNIKEAARLLRVSETSLRRWTNSGALPHLRIGRRRERRFRRGELLAFMETGHPGHHHRPAPPDRFRFGGLPAVAGTHLCGLCASEPARVAQSAQFVAAALGAGSFCILVAAPRVQRRILSAVLTRAPALAKEVASGRLVRAEYMTSARAQIDYFEAQLTNAPWVAGGPVYVVGDLSDGGPERGKPFGRIMSYEAEYERRIARRFPVVTLCQYDARRVSGLDTLAALESHPDTFRYPASSLLA